MMMMKVFNAHIIIYNKNQHKVGIKSANIENFLQ